jgi:hypothetical protein
MLACHLQIDADPDLAFYLMPMRILMQIQFTKMILIRIQNTGKDDDC